MRLSINLINNLHFNTLGWQKSEMQITQLELQNILGKYDFSNVSDLFLSIIFISIPDYYLAFL